MSEQDLRTISLFSGAGGMDRGFADAGFVVTDAYEMDPVASATLRANFPDVVVHEGDLREYFGSLPTADVVIGGPPCQPFSNAGKGRGGYDPRDCFPLAIRAVQEVQPRAFVFENVRGLTFKRHRRYLAQVKQELTALGYVVSGRVLDAADFGVPQHRRRLFIVGLLEEPDAPFTLGEGFPWPEPTHGRGPLPWVSVREALGLEGALHVQRGQGSPRRNHPTNEPSPTVRANMATGGSAGGSLTHVPSHLDDPSPTVVGGSPRSHVNGRSAITSTPKNRRLLEDIAETRRAASEETLRRHPGMELDMPGDAIRGGGDGHSASHQYLAMSNGMGRAEPIDLDNPSRPVLGRTAKDSTDLTRWVEQSAANRTRADAIRDGLIDGDEAYGRKTGGLHKGERTLEADFPSPSQQGASGGRDFLPIMDRPSTMVAAEAGGRMAVPGHHDPERRGVSAQFTAPSGMRYRRLTWQECAKLQAFPDDYLWTGGSTALYRQIGNAVPPPLARAVALALLEALL